MPAATPGDAFAAYCAELLASAGEVRVKRMFGGHGLYLDELFVAIVADEALYLKVGDDTRATFEAAGCAPFVYTGGRQPLTMRFWSVPDDTMDSPDAMAPWARLALQAALSAAAVKRRPARRAPAKAAGKRARH